MNRCMIPIMGGAIIAAFSTPAQAVTGKWCFRWGVDYDDSGAGEDRVTSTEPARYTYVTVSGGGTCYELFLSSAGCTPDDTTILPNTTYTFMQFTRAQRGTRDVYVLADDEPWSSTNVVSVSWTFTTPSYIQNGYTKTFGYPSLINNQIRIMPVVGNMLAYANTLAWDYDLNWDLYVKFPDAYCSGSGHTTHEGHSHICYSGSHLKFGAAHEMGHMISSINGAVFGGDNTGDTGMFRDSADTDHNCDSQWAGGHGHILTSREFIGNASGEGWSQFIASAAYNVRTVTGTFVYGAKEMMKWSDDHRGTLCWDTSLDEACIPAWDTFSDSGTGHVYWNPPHVVPLASGVENDDFVRWVEDECNPATGTFQHYGTEWDWLSFFWNLWVDASDPIEVADIADVWDQVDEVASYCCDANPPTSCGKKNPSTNCGVWPNLPYKLIEHRVGKLWTDDTSFYVADSVLENAAAKFGLGSPEYTLFWNSGTWTRVNY